MNKLVLGIVCYVLASSIAFGDNMKPLTDRYVINEGWLYLERDTESLPEDANDVYTNINLPHTWNAEDTLQTGRYRRVGSWYRKEIEFSSQDLLQRIYLRFGAAGQQAKVYVNGKKLLSHVGGYSAFTCELTGNIKVGKNRVDVWVSNKHHKHIIPHSADFTFYGGLYRSVELIKAPVVSFAKAHLGGPGVRVWSDSVSAESADVKIVAMIDNGNVSSASVQLVVELVDPAGKSVFLGGQNIVVDAEETKSVDLQFANLSNPDLWSPESPTLYTVKIQLLQDDKEIDSISVPHGFRWFEFTANNGFFLNGKSYPLKGVNRHQDFQGLGNALSPKHHRQDIKLMKEAGVNWLRLAHYQQDDYVLELCDELGLLVWEEIPYVNGTSFDPEFETNLRSMMMDLIEQHFNHSSIILWGMGNEVRMKADDDGKARCHGIISRLNDLIHSEDPTRKTIFVIGDANYASRLGVVQIPDVFGYNLYRGWYGTHYNSFTARCEQLRKMDPGKPLIISEFGAGSDMSIHSESPRKMDFSTEYQNDFMESHLKQFEQMKWMCGVNWWNFADFGSASRGNSIPHVNQKGTVTFGRKKKDSFYLMKSMWSDNPVVYIESASWTKRGGAAQKKYRVFSNMDEVTLFHNGNSLGKQTEIFVWDVVLQLGDNTLEAIGRSGTITETHSIAVNFVKTKKAFAVEASSDNGADLAEYAVDEKSFTHWASQGKQWIQLDLENIVLVDGVKIDFFHGDKRHYNFSVKGSSDGKAWKSLFSGQSRKEKKPETFGFEKQAEIRFLRIDANGNDLNNWNAYTEIEPIISYDKEDKSLYEKIGMGKKVE